MGHACAETSICAHGTAHATNVFFRPGRPSEPQAENDGRRPDAAGHTPDVEPYARPRPVVGARGGRNADHCPAKGKNGVFSSKRSAETGDWRTPSRTLSVSRDLAGAMRKAKVTVHYRKWASGKDRDLL